MQVDSTVPYSLLERVLGVVDNCENTQRLLEVCKDIKAYLDSMRELEIKQKLDYTSPPLSVINDPNLKLCRVVDKTGSSVKHTDIEYRKAISEAERLARIYTNDAPFYVLAPVKMFAPREMPIVETDIDVTGGE